MCQTLPTVIRYPMPKTCILPAACPQQPRQFPDTFAKFFLVQSASLNPWPSFGAQVNPIILHPS